MNDAKIGVKCSEEAEFTRLHFLQVFGANSATSVKHIIYKMTCKSATADNYYNLYFMAWGVQITNAGSTSCYRYDAVDTYEDYHKMAGMCPSRLGDTDCIVRFMHPSFVSPYHVNKPILRNFWVSRCSSY